LFSFRNDSKPVPIAGVVSLNGDGNVDLGGGSGGVKQEDVNPFTNPSTPSRPIPEADLAKIDPLKEWTPKVPSLEEGLRPEDLPAAQKIAKMQEELRKALIEGMKGKKAGSGDNEGTGHTGNQGVGSGTGDPNSAANRSLRWDLNFKTSSGEDYLKQLSAMKANLVIQQPADWKVSKVYRDLHSATGEPFNMDDIKGKIYFVDDDPTSASKVARALGLDFDPPRFVAFFPKEIEEELARKEKEYRGREPSQIFSTSFRILQVDGKPQIRVSDQIPVTGRGK
jgi:hypothetical protein